jgi:SAM-dependent methyltransferase
MKNMLGKSPWRKLLYPELKKLALSGLVLDLGGARVSDYHRLFGGTYTIQVANNDKDTHPDFLFDFENKFPVEDHSFDTVLCLNTLEHIFNYEQFLSESKRVLKPKGKIVLAVPFLVQVHPSPKDYFRYSEQALKRMFEATGFDQVVVTPIGRGPFTASAQVLYNALHVAPLRALTFVIALAFDKCLGGITGAHYGRNSYPLGYLITATVRA